MCVCVCGVCGQTIYVVNGLLIIRGRKERRKEERKEERRYTCVCVHTCTFTCMISCVHV